jgi:hypothetical protein
MMNVGAQGELRVYAISALPDNIGNTRPARDKNGAFILAHSEKGHHHVIGGDVDVIEHVENQVIGGQTLAMRTLYAIVKAPTALHQTATQGHADLMLAEGIYAIRADVEFNPFADEIREVQD